MRRAPELDWRSPKPSGQVSCPWANRPVPSAREPPRCSAASYHSAALRLHQPIDPPQLSAPGLPPRASALLATWRGPEPAGPHPPPVRRCSETTHLRRRRPEPRLQPSARRHRRETDYPGAAPGCLYRPPGGRHTGSGCRRTSLAALWTRACAPPVSSAAPPVTAAAPWLSSPPEARLPATALWPARLTSRAEISGS